MVRVPVGHEDRVQGLRLLDLRRHRIVQPGIDCDRRTAWLESRLRELDPRDLERLEAADPASRVTVRPSVDAT